MAQKVDLAVATEIVEVINNFEYRNWPEDLTWLDQVRHDIAHSVVLFLSGRAENIYPAEPGIFHPGLRNDAPQEEVPELTLHQIDNFLHRVPPGDFIRSFLSNDLTATLSFADESNMKCLLEIWHYCRRTLPVESWGSEECVNLWLAGPQGQGEDEDARER